MNVGELIAQGGWAMWPIYACSVIALIVFCERLFRFRAIRATPQAWLRQVLHLVRTQDYAAARKQCEAQAHPIAEVLHATIEVFQHRPVRVMAEAERHGQRQLQQYENYLPLLAFITQVTPLLGLLGTVLGMVKMFFGLQNAGMTNVNVTALSAGIWQALLTTAAGLLVAAPSLAGYTYLTSRVNRFRAQLNDAVIQLLTAFPETSTAGHHSHSSSPLAHQHATPSPHATLPSTAQVVTPFIEPPARYAHHPSSPSLPPPSHQPPLLHQVLQKTTTTRPARKG